MMIADRRLLLMMSMPVALLAGWTASQWLRRGDVFVIPLAAQLLPIPIAFLMLILLFERDKRFTETQTFAAAIGALIFVMGARLNVADHYGIWRWGILAGGMLIACFSYIRPQEFWQHTRANPRPVAIALLAASCAKAYFFLSLTIWYHMCAATAWCIYKILMLFGSNTILNIRMAGTPQAPEPAIHLMSPHFKLKVYEACSGLEGMFLVLFLLSCLLLSDWKLFSRLRCSVLIVATIAFMFGFNVLRILLLYLFANWAFDPTSPGFARSLRGWPLDMFHSFIGWTLYLVAFGIIASALYHVATKKPASMRWLFRSE